MKKILLYSLLLILGLSGSQFVDGTAEEIVNLGTMLCLSFIMIHVGYEFEIDKSKPTQYIKDYIIAGTSAAFPWLFCAAYFIWIIGMDSWKDALLVARFSSPTSAGVLFSMLAVAGLSATWMFRKARILAIFDDLDTILLMIPLKMMIVGMRWQLIVVIFVIIALLWLAWRYLHLISLPIKWPWVILYSFLITAISEILHLASGLIDEAVPIDIEVLLPAFVLGCMLKRPPGHSSHTDDAIRGNPEELERPKEQRVAMIITSVFMVLVGLSMPVIVGDNVDWKILAEHVFLITVLSNIGKMFPVLCYREEATVRERLALSISMFPRGEVGAGVLVVSMGYGLGGEVLTVAAFSLALNLLLTGLFIVVVKKLLEKPKLANG